MSTTTHLNITKVSDDAQFANDAFNLSLDSVDEQVFAAIETHADSAAHWSLWEASTTYAIGDIVRYASLKSNQYVQCTVAGTSGTVTPTVNVTGTTITDNTVTWVVYALTTPITIHNDLEGRSVSGAHPISAITNLQTSLDAKVNKTDYTEAGIIEYPTITDNGDGTISLSGGVYNLYADSTGTTPLTQYNGVSQTLTLTDAENNYVCASVSSSAIVYTLVELSTVDFLSIIPVYTVYRSGTSLYALEWGDYAKGLASLILKKWNRTSRFTRESGLLLGESSGRIITLTSGVVWFSVESMSLSAVDSSSDIVYQCINTNGTWTYTAVTQYNNTQYNPTTGIATLSNNKYNVTWVYRDVKTSVNRLYLVLGTGNYTLSEAYASTIPTIPDLLTKQCVLVGRIICEEDATTATSIESAFTGGFSGGSGSTNASDITITDAGSYFTGTDVETALQELGVDKHTHSNKTQLDKIGEDISGNLTYDGNSVVGGAKVWTASTAYIVGQLVTYGGCLYRCITAHTSSAFNTDIADWSIVYANIQPWTASIYYPLNSWVYNNATLYKCTTAHTSGSSLDTTELTYWAIGGSAVGISSMTYDGTASTFSVTLSDNTTKTFTGIGSNFYEGYAKTEIITAPITATGSYSLAYDITAQDFLHFTVGVTEGYYKPFAIKTSDITWTKTLGSVVQTTSLGSTGTVSISGTYTKTVDETIYLKVVTAPTATGSLAGMVVGISDDGSTYTSQTAFTAGLTATLEYHGITITFTVTESTTFIVNEIYDYTITVNSSTTFLMDGANGSNNYAIVCHFKNNNILIVDSLSSTTWTNPQIINMCGYKGQSNNVTALKTSLLYSGTTSQTANSSTGNPTTYTLSDSILNYDYIYITCILSAAGVSHDTLIKVSQWVENSIHPINASNGSTVLVDGYYDYIGAELLRVRIYVDGYGAYTLTNVYGIVSGDGKVTLSQSQQNGKYSLTLTNVDGTSTIELPYVTLLSGSVAEISDDNTLHITHSDNTTTIGEAKEKYDILWTGTQGSTTITRVSHTIALSSSLSNYRKIGISYYEIPTDTTSDKKYIYRELLVSQIEEIIAGGTHYQAGFTWGYSNFTDHSDLLSTSTLTVLAFNSVYSIITGIYGIY